MLLTKPQIALLQQTFNKVGIDSGAVDGITGPKTQAAALTVLKALGGAVPAASSPAHIDPETALLMKELLRDEAFVPHAYQDHLGWWTIGIGRLIDKRKGGRITRAEADYLKANDIAEKRAHLDATIPWWRKLDPVRQRALQNMAFQLGTGDMRGATFDLISDGKYKAAAARLRSWKWAKQTPARAARVIKMIETGKA